MSQMARELIHLLYFANFSRAGFKVIFCSSNIEIVASTLFQKKSQTKQTEYEHKSCVHGRF